MTQKKVVLVTGNFNVVHPGHLRLLRFAKECGDRLIVAVKSDALAGLDAHVPESLRLEGVKSNSLVDEAFITTESIADLITKLRPDIIVKGKEHEGQDNPELAVLKSYGGNLLFSSGETIFSSLDLIRREFQKFDTKTISLPQQYIKRHEINISRLIKIIQNYANLKVGVIGDLIIDEYITCQPLGMSQEDPTIVVTPIDSVRFIGGAGIVAAHASGLGASVKFFSIVGPDEVGKYAADQLNQLGIVAHILCDETRPTTLKQRYRSKGKSLLRVSHLHEGAISQKLQEQMLSMINLEVPNLDVLVFSDFNYGCLPQTLVDKVIKLALQHNVYMAADSQSSSQIGDIARFKRMDLITPTEREARLSMKNREDGLVVLAEKLRVQSDAKNVFLKMGEEGLLIHATSNDQQPEWMTDRVDALNLNPKDVAGAGDSLLITGAMALALGANIWEAALLGSLAAAVQVGRVGNTPLQVKQLLEEIE
jgi:rfaE bifunctional protein kinase chain/domain